MIAQLLSVELSTVRTHIKHLHEKCGTDGLVSLAVWAESHRWCCVVVDRLSPSELGVSRLPDDLTLRGNEI